MKETPVDSGWSVLCSCGALAWRARGKESYQGVAHTFGTSVAVYRSHENELGRQVAEVPHDAEELCAQHLAWVAP